MGLIGEQWGLKLQSQEEARNDNESFHNVDIRVQNSRCLVPRHLFIILSEKKTLPKPK